MTETLINTGLQENNNFHSNGTSSNINFVGEVVELDGSPAELTLNLDTSNNFESLKENRVTKISVDKDNSANSVEAIIESKEFQAELKALIKEQMRSNIKSTTATEQLATLLLNSVNDQLSSPKRSSAVNTEKKNLKSETPVQNGDFKAVSSAPSSPSVHTSPPNIIPINDLRGSQSIGLSSEEAYLRCQLASLYRLIDIHGWTFGLYHHISSRINSKSFLINTFGLLYHEVTASNLAKISLEGGPVDKNSRPPTINKAGWSIHSAIHSSRPDINCILHLHLPDVVAISAMKCGLLPVSAEAETLLKPYNLQEKRESGLVRFHSFLGTPLEGKQKEQLVKDLGKQAKVLFLQNHGAVVCGATVQEVWKLARMLVVGCQAQTRLVSIGGLSTAMEAADSAFSRPQTAGLATFDSEACNLEWEAMMRMLDNAGYRSNHRYSKPQLMQRVIGSLTEAAVNSMTSGQQALLSTPLISHSSYDFDEKSAKENCEKIKKTVTDNKMRAFQRNKYLSKSVEWKTELDLNTEKIVARMTAEQNQQSSRSHQQKVNSTATPSAVSSKPPIGLSAKPVNLDSKVKSETHSPIINKSATFSHAVNHTVTVVDRIHKDDMASSEVDSKRNTLPTDAGSGDEGRSLKKGLKIGGIRIPSFSKKKK